jgi:FkbM family methyltransferase
MKLMRLVPNCIRQRFRAWMEPLVARLAARWPPSLALQERFRVRQRLNPPMPLDYPGHPILLHVSGSLEATVRINSCAKEPGTVAWIESHLRPGDVLYDIGANVGAYSLIAAKHVANQATIVAFEPGFNNFAQLCRNVLLNDTAASIIPLAVPLGRDTRLSDFHFGSLTIGAAKNSLGRPVNYHGESFAPIASLRTVGWSLDELMLAARLPPPTLLKIDVDGLELAVLEGARRLLAAGTLRGILIELNEQVAQQCNAIIDLLHAAGLAPIEKHHLAQGLYNYAFARSEARLLQEAGLLVADGRDRSGAQGASARPGDVPVTWRRQAATSAAA